MNTTPRLDPDLPFCPACTLPMLPATHDHRPLWRCPRCRLAAIVPIPHPHPYDSAG